VSTLNVIPNKIFCIGDDVFYDLLAGITDNLSFLAPVTSIVPGKEFEILLDFEQKRLFPFRASCFIRALELAKRWISWKIELGAKRRFD